VRPRKLDATSHVVAVAGKNIRNVADLTLSKFSSTLREY
jgi:hypothetical protein